MQLICAPIWGTVSDRCGYKPILAIGMLGAMAGIGVIIGPLMGRLLPADSLSLPFFAGSRLDFIARLLVIFILPESKPASSQTGELVSPNKPTQVFRPDSATPRLLDIYLRIWELQKSLPPLSFDPGPHHGDIHHRYHGVKSSKLTVTQVSRAMGAVRFQVGCDLIDDDCHDQVAESIQHLKLREEI